MSSLGLFSRCPLNSVSASISRPLMRYFSGRGSAAADANGPAAVTKTESTNPKMRLPRMMTLRADPGRFPSVCLWRRLRRSAYHRDCALTRGGTARRPVFRWQKVRCPNGQYDECSETIRIRGAATRVQRSDSAARFWSSGSLTSPRHVVPIGIRLKATVWIRHQSHRQHSPEAI